MIHQPQAKQGSQSVEGVLADLEGQRARLLSAVTWVRGVADGVRAAIGSGQVEFTNTAYLTAQSVQAEIAISMPTPQGVKDVPAFTISCAVPPAEQATLLADPLASLEALGNVTAQRWLDAYGTRPFEVWVVKETRIWRGDEAATAVWLSKQVKGWLEWWFKAAPRIAYRPRKGLEVAFQGVKPIVAPGASQAAQRKP
jgi:hypothetical protein